MTQQNETEQGTAAPEQSAWPEQLPAHGTPAPAAPFFPSPYLDGGGIPQAYLAPPQPDQPRYGTPAGVRGRPFGAQRGYGREGDPQQGASQPADRPGGGQQPTGRPGLQIGLGAAARRDPALALPWQRLVASVLDWIIITLVSIVAFWSPLSDVVRQLRAVTTHYPDFTSPAAQAAINSISRDSANQHALLYWFLGIFGIALVYYWVQHAAWGATLGKRALGMRVVRAADRSRIGVLTAGLRTVTFLAGPAIFLLLISPINAVGGVLWAADAGLPLLDARAQSLHDKVAGTVVVRARS